MTREELIHDINHTRSILRVLYGYGGTMISYDRCNMEQLKRVREALFKLAKAFMERKEVNV